MGMLFGGWAEEERQNEFDRLNEEQAAQLKARFPDLFPQDQGTFVEVKNSPASKSTLEEIRAALKTKDLNPFEGDILPPPDHLSTNLKLKLAQLDAQDRVILPGTDGDDYEQLDKVDPQTKVDALNGNLPDVESIQVASENALQEAAGPGYDELTPEQKQWILLTLGFSGIEAQLKSTSKSLLKGVWFHPYLKLTIEFDITKDHIFSIVHKIFKNGQEDGIQRTGQNGQNRY